MTDVVSKLVVGSVDRRVEFIVLNHGPVNVVVVDSGVELSYLVDRVDILAVARLLGRGE